jgi:hypothetical protein
MRLFRRAPRQSVPAQIAPEFGVHVTLRRGDKIVHRDARGVIRITRISEERVHLTDLGVPGPDPGSLPRG